jgi:hypothetical protein
LRDHPQIWGKLFLNVDWDMCFEHEKRNQLEL